MKYYDKKNECMSQEQIKKLQLDLLNRQIKRAQKAVVYLDNPIKQIDALSEIISLPFTTKENLRQNFPYGFLAIPQEKIARFNATSGTTGIPTLAFFSYNDLKQVSERTARNLYCAGVRKCSFVQSMLNGGLFVGGWNYQEGLKKIGATLVPTGSGNTIRQIYFLTQLKSEFCVSTAGYLMHLLSLITSREWPEIKLKAALVSGEPISSVFKEMILKNYHIDIYENYGLTETCGAIAAECPYHKGLHIAEDYFYVEIINPDTGEVLPEGEYGELVVTPLQQEAMPLIRYRTRDITRIIPGECPCGRTHRRIEPITHRIDDMMIINGVNVFPSQIEECIYKHLTTATNYLIHITEKEGLKKLLIDIELPNDLLSNVEGLKVLGEELISTMKAYITVTPKLNFIPKGILPEIQGKAKRIVKD